MCTIHSYGMLVSRWQAMLVNNTSPFHCLLYPLFLCTPFKAAALCCCLCNALTFVVLCVALLEQQGDCVLSTWTRKNSLVGGWEICVFLGTRGNPRKFLTRGIFWKEGNSRAPEHVGLSRSFGVNCVFVPEIVPNVCCSRQCCRHSVQDRR